MCGIMELMQKQTWEESISYCYVGIENDTIVYKYEYTIYNNMEPHIIFLNSLYVTEKYRGRGIFKKIMELKNLPENITEVRLSVYFPENKLMFYDQIRKNKKLIKKYMDYGFEQLYEIENGDKFMYLYKNISK